MLTRAAGFFVSSRFDSIRSDSIRFNSIEMRRTDRRVGLLLRLRDGLKLSRSRMIAIDRWILSRLSWDSACASAHGRRCAVPAFSLAWPRDEDCFRLAYRTYLEEFLGSLEQRRSRRFPKEFLQVRASEPESLRRPKPSSEPRRRLRIHRRIAIAFRSRRGGAGSPRNQRSVTDRDKTSSRRV